MRVLQPGVGHASGNVLVICPGDPVPQGRS